MIIFLLTLIVVCQIILVIAGALMWKKVNYYLIWNTRNESLEYEKAIQTPKIRRPAGKPSKTEQKGRTVKPVDDLVDLQDLDFETAVKAIEDI